MHAYRNTFNLMSFIIHNIKNIINKNSFKFFILHKATSKITNISRVSISNKKKLKKKFSHVADDRNSIRI